MVIVGGGVFGLCTLLKLAQRGVQCLLLESGELAKGASGLSGGMVRLWHASPKMRELAAVGQEFWKSRVGFHKTGSLYFELPGQKPDLSTDCEWITPDVGRERFPDFHWDDDDGAVFEADAGWVDTRVACLAVAQEAREAGAEIRTGTTVERVEGKTVHLKDESIEAQAVIWAGGCHGIEALSGDIPESENRYIQVLELEGEYPELPCFLDRRTLGFGRAIHGGALWIGVGLKSIAPDHRTIEFDKNDASRAQEIVSGRLPLVSGRKIIQGVRTPDRYSPDRMPRFGASGQDGLFWAWCGSGGGFKMAPALAGGLAEEVRQCL